MNIKEIDNIDQLNIYQQNVKQNIGYKVCEVVKYWYDVVLFNNKNQYIDYEMEKGLFTNMIEDILINPNMWIKFVKEIDDE
jgi:hypothetical protein